MYLRILSLVFVVFFTISCKKEEVIKKSKGSVYCIVDDASYHSFTVKGIVTNNGNDDIIEKGVVYNTEPNVSYSNNVFVNNENTDRYLCNIENVKAGTKYYIRTFLINSVDTSYSHLDSIMTLGQLAQTKFDLCEITESGVEMKATCIFKDDLPILEKGFLWTEKDTSSILDDKKIVVNGDDNVFETILTEELQHGHVFYFAPYITNEVGTTIGEVKQVLTDLKDIEGNSYRIIADGDLLWMAENLRVSKYNNGNPIPDVKIAKSVTELNNIQNPDNPLEYIIAFQTYYEEKQENLEIYGRLYSGMVIRSNENVCPEGWNIPTKNDFEKLRNGNNFSYIKPGESDTDFQENYKNFSPLASGYCYIKDNKIIYDAISKWAVFWSSDIYEKINSTNYGLNFYNSDSNIYGIFHMNSANSIRCIKDVSKSR